MVRAVPIQHQRGPEGKPWHDDTMRYLNYRINAKSSTKLSIGAWSFLSCLNFAKGSPVAFPLVLRRDGPNHIWHVGMR